MSVMPAYRAGSPAPLGLDADATAWAASVVTNGGTVSADQKALVSTLISSLKAAGSWASLDDAWLLVAESSVQALTSLKQRRLATIGAGTPAFTAGAGYAFDASNYIDTGFIPITHAVAMTATNARPAVYERTNVAGTGYAMGVNQNSGRILGVRPRQSGAVAALNANWTAGTFTLAVDDSRGFTSGSRNGGDVTTVAAYKNGTAMSRASDPSAYGATLPTTSIFIGGLNTSGSLTSGRASTIGWVSAGASLTAAQELAEYNAIQAYMTAKGANV